MNFRITVFLLFICLCTPQLSLAGKGGHGTQRSWLKSLFTAWATANLAYTGPTEVAATNTTGNGTLPVCPKGQTYKTWTECLSYERVCDTLCVCPPSEYFPEYCPPADCSNPCRRRLRVKTATQPRKMQYDDGYDDPGYGGGDDDPGYEGDDDGGGVGGDDDGGGTGGNDDPSCGCYEPACEPGYWYDPPCNFPECSTSCADGECLVSIQKSGCKKNSTGSCFPGDVYLRVQLLDDKGHPQKNSRGENLTELRPMSAISKGDQVEVRPNVFQTVDTFAHRDEDRIESDFYKISTKINV